MNYIDAIQIELENAEIKHPNWPNDVIHATAIMQEESGEAIRAAIQYVYEKGKVKDIEKELIQTAAMCLRCLYNLPTI